MPMLKHRARHQGKHEQQRQLHYHQHSQQRQPLSRRPIGDESGQQHHRDDQQIIPAQARDQGEQRRGPDGFEDIARIAQYGNLGR